MKQAKSRRQYSVDSRQHQTRRLAAPIYCLLFTLYCLLFSFPALGQYGRPPESSLPQGGQPQVLKQVRIDQQLGAQLPLDLTFRDETGRSVRLGEYFGGRPVILSLVYYECPMLCNEVLNGLTGVLETLPFNAGREFNVVTVSFDAREGPQVAAAKKKTYLRRYGRQGADEGWHFLTGEQASIDRLTEAVGFRYVWDPVSNQFAHSSAIMVATPQGKLSHYFYGIEYGPKDVRLALVEASANKIGSPVDQLLLYCYHYDPTTGKYGPVIMNIMRVAGILTVLGIFALVMVLRRRRRADEETWDESVIRGGTA